jgi:cation:H+ antiporter
LANILLILGVGALVAKKALKVQDNTLYYEIPFSLLAVIVLWILVNDKLLNGLDYNVLSRGDGLILLCFFAVFMYYIFSLIRSDKGKIDVESDSYGMIVSLLLVILGALGLYFGGELVVNNAVWFAQKLGVSTFLIGASIVAI